MAPLAAAAADVDFVVAVVAEVVALLLATAAAPLFFGLHAVFLLAFVCLVDCLTRTDRGTSICTGPSLMMCHTDPRGLLDARGSSHHTAPRVACLEYAKCLAPPLTAVMDC